VVGFGKYCANKVHIISSVSCFTIHTSQLRRVGSGSVFFSRVISVKDASASLVNARFVWKQILFFDWLLVIPYCTKIMNTRYLLRCVVVARFICLHFRVASSKYFS